MDNTPNLSPDENNSYEVFLDDSDIALTNLQQKRNEDLQLRVQRWTDTLYNLAKKVIIVALGIVFLFDVIRPREDSTIEIIQELYGLSLEQGKLEFLAPAVAIFLLARNLPIFVKGMRKMFKDS